MSKYTKGGKNFIKVTMEKEVIEIEEEEVKNPFLFREIDDVIAEPNLP